MLKLNKKLSKLDKIIGHTFRYYDDFYLILKDENDYIIVFLKGKIECWDKVYTLDDICIK